MSKCTPYHTIADADEDKCYHDNDECPSGKNIKPENKQQGTDNRPLCEICRTMN